MPTPIGHALGGIAAGCLIVAGSSVALRNSASWRRFNAVIVRIGPRHAVAVLACLGALPDIDLLFGMHRSVTHSMGATLLTAAIAGAITSFARLPIALAAAAAFASHMLLDWLGTDPGLPYGIMALWPWTEEFYLSDLELFMRVCREYWTIECWWHNSLALLRELVMLVPVTVATLLVARRSVRQRKPL